MIGRKAIGLGLAFVGTAVVAQPVPNSYRTRLTTAAFEPQARSFKGDGNVVATIAGRTLMVTGEYKSLDSPATRIRLLSGPIVGAAGRVPVATLPVSGEATNGAIRGSVQLSAAQASALKAGRIYVQVDTKAAPEGALWGWLMPNRPFVGDGVPERENWFAR